MRTGVDVREMDLTMEQAGDMLDEPQGHNNALREVLIRKGGVAKRNRVAGVTHLQQSNQSRPSTPPTDGAAGTDGVTTDDATAIDGSAALTVEVVYSDEQGVLMEAGPALAALLSPGTRFRAQLTREGLLLGRIRGD